MTRLGPAPRSLNTHSFSTDRLYVALPDPSDAAPLFDLVKGPDRREVCADPLWDGPDTVDDMVGWLGDAERRPSTNSVTTG